MATLALEFSTSRRSAALLSGDPAGAGSLAEASDSTEPRRGTGAFALMARVLEKAGIARSHVTSLAVGLGPGSYTGIRAAISIAQGWEAATGLTLIGVPSHEALAAGIHATGWRGRVTLAFDAQRGELYAARYRITTTGPEIDEPLRLASPQEVARRIQEGERVVGPDLERLLPEAEALHPDAAFIARLAARGRTRTPGAELQPIYLREVEFKKIAQPPSSPG
ncbi:MAG TPA: tRNA (adenosine(37)-N6)-threonylcarbamoyltransferase complex dimerization subunit type 1 TsaB [Verrucomicrobiales bacterium]|nr:tRNA (adenosine(37)-N6)-threonylcarbamoyltransferase complex dimerization subunit type 1 TsaB [Verrucomicrobiales bacterium]